MRGKVVLLTGATSGIGRAAALLFARQGATLVVVGRNAAALEPLTAELKRQSGNDHIESLAGDLSNRADVRAVAAAFLARHSRLDVLANNAGAQFAERTLSADGFEMTFALNHLGYFWLTRELREILARTPAARVVNTASGSHRRGRLTQLDEVARREHGYSAAQAYADSKLANILFTRELARRGVWAACFNPGFTRTGFGVGGHSLAARSRRMLLPLAGSPVAAAETLLWLADSEDAVKLSGQYVRRRRAASVTGTLPPLLSLALVMGAATIGGQLAARLHQPPIGGEALLGVLSARLSSSGIPLGKSQLEQLGERLWTFSEAT